MKADNCAYVVVGEEFRLTATSILYNIPTQNETKIRWARWDRTDNTKSILEKSEERGRTIKQVFESSDLGKQIWFCPFLDGVQEPWKGICLNDRIIICAVVNKNDKYLIREVICEKNANVGDKIDVKVTKYNYTTVPDSIKNSVRWMISLDNGTPEQLFINDNLAIGGAVSLEVSKNWSGKQVVFMPYLKEYTTKVSTATIIEEYGPIVIFVNGYWNTGKIEDLTGGDSKENYWGRGLVNAAKLYFFKTDHNLYINGADTMFSSGKVRYENGKDFASKRFDNPNSLFHKEVYKKYRKIMVVSHSMGAAFAEGIISYLNSKSVNVVKVVHLSPADNSDFNVTLPGATYQIDIMPDPVLDFKNLNDATFIKGVRYAAIIANEHDKMYGHYYTKSQSYVCHWFEDLETMQFVPAGKGEIISTTGAYYSEYGASFPVKMTCDLYKSINCNYNTRFIKVLEDSAVYEHYYEKDKYYSL